MKKIDWRDIVITIIIGLISIMAFFTLVDWTIEKDNIVGVGNIVTFVGSIIGGALTLIGVKWTLDSQKRNEVQQKYEKANFIFTELLPKLIDTYSEIKTLSPQNWNSTIEMVLEKSKILEKQASEMTKISIHLGVEFYREVKNIEYYAMRINELIENEIINPGRTDQQIYNDLLVFYNGLAKADKELFEMVKQIKHS